jgi:hypothetical protein
MFRRSAIPIWRRSRPIGRASATAARCHRGPTSIQPKYARSCPIFSSWKSTSPCASVSGWWERESASGGMRTTPANGSTNWIMTACARRSSNNMRALRGPAAGMRRCGLRGRQRRVSPRTAIAAALVRRWRHAEHAARYAKGHRHRWLLDSRATVDVTATGAWADLGPPLARLRKITARRFAPRVEADRS